VFGLVNHLISSSPQSINMPWLASSEKQTLHSFLK
jgi:hypothetical protein